MFGKNWLPRILLGIHFITEISQCAVFISLWNWFFFWGEARQEAQSVFGTQLSTEDAHRRGRGTPPCSPHQPAVQGANSGDGTAWGQHGCPLSALPKSHPALVTHITGYFWDPPAFLSGPENIRLVAWSSALSLSKLKQSTSPFVFVWGSSYNEKEWRNSKPGL